jgi:uncharacterized protein (TIGR02466 family)
MKIEKNYIIENWFSSPIYSCNALPYAEKLLNPVLEHLKAEKINKDRFWLGKTTYNTQINLANDPTFFDFLNFIKDNAKTFLDNLGYDYEILSKKFDPYIFATELNYGSYQERHIHAYKLSGILYLKVPENSAPIQFNDPIITREYESWPVKNSNNPNTFLTVNYKPQVGSMLMWPSWLYHEVPTHTVKENRIGLVFNL